MNGNARFYGDQLSIAIGGRPDRETMDALMSAAMESSGWFGMLDERISDIDIDDGPEGIREAAESALDEHGRLVIVAVRPHPDEERSVASTCRRLGLPYVSTLVSLDAGREDVSTYWTPGMTEPLDVPEDGDAVPVPPFEKEY
jgi:hypothetical protein